ncbi:MAG TPA: GAF domain-containing sensor histidine kinase [Terriglobales bacterium]|nr:GAF domain-containing sensor histidine kinase [Terriglobales bacterium]
MNPHAAVGFPLLAVAALNFAIGGLLLARARGDAVARNAGALGLVNAVYCAVVAMAYVRASAGLSYDLYYRSAWVGWIGLAPMAQIILSLKGDPAAAQRVGRILYATWAAVLALCLTTDLFEGGALSLVPFVDRVGWLERPARAAGAVILCWALVELWRVQRASAGRRRQQLAYFLLGLALYGVAGLLLAGVFQIVGDVHFDPALVSYFSVVWMALTFYAITRHRLFDVRFVMSRAITALLLTLCLVVMQSLLFGWLVPSLGAAASIVVASIVSGTVLFTTSLPALVERKIGGLLLQSRHDYGQAMKESVRVLASIGTVDDVLKQFVSSIRDTIASTSATLLLREDDEFHCRQSYGCPGEPAALGRDMPLARWLREQPQPFVREEQQLAMSATELATIDEDLRHFCGEVAVAMRYRGEMIGILVVGAKADRDAFFQADLDLLETLANEVAIAVTNARLLEDLQRAVRARDDFVAVAGHELRTPLMALHLNIHTARRAAGDDKAVTDRLHAAERQALRLARLTNELLDASRITEGRMRLEREPTDLAALVREVAERLTDEAQRCGSTLELMTPEEASGHWDRLRIDQVVSNLLSNAVKYGGGRPITVVVECAQSRARLIVRDQGIGICESDQERIFDRFERAGNAPRSGGFGLGLWITKQIVEAHGGVITVESRPGTGSTFAVELPLN